MSPSIRDLLANGKRDLAQHEISEVDAELLLAHIMKISRMELHANSKVESDHELEQISVEFKDAITARIGGRPTQYIIGEAPFRYLMLDVGEGVLIPRPETESLAELALKEARQRAGALIIVDLGSGTGAIALSLATELSHRSDLDIYAVEKEDSALYWLNRNCEKLGGSVKVIHVAARDALAGTPIEGHVDIVVANPPYIPSNQLLPLDVRREPESALFGGSDDGMEIPREFIAAATRLLKPGGFFACEHHESQGPLFAAELSKDFAQINLHHDLTDRPRFTTAIKR
jgi:release factor glutamine methyltransferase